MSNSPYKIPKGKNAADADGEAEKLLPNTENELNNKSFLEKLRLSFFHFSDYMFKKLLDFFRWSDHAFKKFRSNFFRWSNNIAQKYKFLHHAWSIVSSSLELAKNLILEPLLKVIPLANFIASTIFTIIEFVDLVITKTDLDEEEQQLFNEGERKTIIQEKHDSKKIKIINAIIGTSLGIAAFAVVVFLAMTPVGLGLLLAATVLAAAKDIYFFTKARSALKKESVPFVKKRREFEQCFNDNNIKSQIAYFNDLNKKINELTLAIALESEIKRFVDLGSEVPANRQKLADLCAEKAKLSITGDIDVNELTARKKEFELLLENTKKEILKTGIIEKYAQYTESKKQLPKIAKLKKIYDEKKSAVLYSFLGVATMLLFTLAAVAVLNPYTLTAIAISLLCVSFVKAVKDKMYSKKEGKKKENLKEIMIDNFIAETEKDKAKTYTNGTSMKNDHATGHIVHQMAVSNILCKRSEIEAVVQAEIRAKKTEILSTDNASENKSEASVTPLATETRAPTVERSVPDAVVQLTTKEVEQSVSNVKAVNKNH